MYRQYSHILFSSLLIVNFADAVYSAATTPDPDRGLYSLSGGSTYLDLPYITGGRILVQWADLETAEGVYDFSSLDSALQPYFQSGRKTTVQVNGLRKPRWLYQKVAVLPGQFTQVGDPEGALQYWDPIYINAYKNFVAAYGNHLRHSPYRSALLGIRQNFNSIGTELGKLSGSDTDPANWQPAPDGHIYNVPWTEEIYRNYRREIVAAFIQAFRPEMTIFVRNNVFTDNTLTPEQIDMVDRGELALFHTSSEHQPHTYDGGGTDDAKFQAFQTYCLTGKTLGYTEPWRPSTTNDYGIVPLQYNYWRILLDLSCGISFIAMKPGDLDLRGNPEYSEAFIFGAKYVGYHVSPSTSPGAWVAMREGDSLKGDYNFMMERIAGSGGTPLTSQGPADQRFSLWARSISGAEKMVFKLNPTFAQSLASAKIRVVYLDQGVNSFTVSWNVSESVNAHVVQKQNTGRWQELIIDVPYADFTASLEGGDITLIGGGTNIFHMVEVIREASTETNASHWQKYAQ